LSRIQLTLFGLFAVTLMLIFYALEGHDITRAKLHAAARPAASVWRQFPTAMSKQKKDGAFGAVWPSGLPNVGLFRDAQAGERLGDATFEPGDDFCALWHILDLLPGGAGDWAPKFSYQ
jgi:hypothetical protein